MGSQRRRRASVYLTNSGSKPAGGRRLGTAQLKVFSTGFDAFNVTQMLARSRRVPGTIAFALYLVASGRATAGMASAEAPAVAATAYQSDPAHDGLAPSEGVKLPLTPLWSVAAKSPSYPLIAQGLVIVTQGQGDTYGTLVVALDAHTGQEVWSHPITGTYF